MRKMSHESVAKDLAKKTKKMISKNGTEIEVSLNMVSFYIRRNGEMIEFWSAEKCAEAPVTASEEELYQTFLGALNRSLSRSYPIEYIA